MKRCLKCGKNDWKFDYNSDDKMVIAYCNNCGNIVIFPAKKSKYNLKERPFAIYENRKDGTYLKTNNHDFIKVGLLIESNYVKVVPYIKSNYMKNLWT